MAKNTRKPSINLAQMCIERLAKGEPEIIGSYSMTCSGSPKNYSTVKQNILMARAKTNPQEQTA